jgi:hypothetical protein
LATFWVRRWVRTATLVPTNAEVEAVMADIVCAPTHSRPLEATADAGVRERAGDSAHARVVEWIGVCARRTRKARNVERECVDRTPTIECVYSVMGACCGKQAGADGGLGSASSAPPTIPQRKPQPAAEANNLRRWVARSCVHPTTHAPTQSGRSQLPLGEMQRQLVSHGGWLNRAWCVHARQYAATRASARRRGSERGW